MLLLSGAHASSRAYSASPVTRIEVPPLAAEAKIWPWIRNATFLPSGETR